MPVYQCDKAGKDVKNYMGEKRACKYCDGRVVKEGNYIQAPKLTEMLPYPTKADCGFDCLLFRVQRGEV